MRAPLVRLACLLGLALGAAEVGLRADPRLGLSTQAALTWLGLACGISVAVLLASALGLYLLVRLAGPRVPAAGWLALAGVTLHGALAWRFDLHSFARISEPHVWGGLLGIALGGLAAGALLDRPLRAAGRGLDAAVLLVFVVGTGAALLRSLPEDRARRVDPGHPNLVLITLDTVRADALSPWNPARDTPAAARLAAEGATFEQAVASAPLTEPSHLAMLSGQPPHRSGVVANGTVLPADLGRVPEILRSAGWKTAAFVSGFPLHARYGWSRGFDVYDDDFGTVPGLHRLSLVRAWDALARPAHTLRERRGDRTARRALAWLDTHGRTGPWFLWLHLFDPHGPYEPPPPFAPSRDPVAGGPALGLPAFWPPRWQAVTDAAWLTEAYLGEVRFADAQVGRVLDHLAASDRLDATAVVLVSDHGESLGEHGYAFDHGDDLYDPSLVVPLLVRAPGRVPPGSRVACQVPTSDLARTLLDLVGVPGADVPGTSLLPLLQGTCVEREVVATTVATRNVADPPVDHALRSQGFKWIRPEVRPPGLFDLGADPGEVRDLAPDRPAEAARLDALLEARLAGSGPVRAPDAGMATLEALEALGYLE
ncbi:MAG: sulfatase [Deltaproteobacteria bacterium]|nr:sulfatase [Deltaproteobacteria bacterium]